MSPEPTPSVGSAAIRGERPVFHPERLVAVLGRFKVSYVLTGSLAARLHGSPLLTAIADLVPALTAPNLDAVANALRHLNARIYSETAPTGSDFEITPDTLMHSASWDLITSCGRLRMAYRPAGGRTFDAIAKDAVRFMIHSDQVLVASLDDLVRMHEPPPSAEASAEGAVLRALQARSAGY